MRFNSSINGPENKFTYNGKELEDEHGLNWYHYGARFYDPQLGRWHAVDPMGTSFYAAMSPYNYVLNNPIAFKDQEGKWVIYAVFGVKAGGYLTLGGSGMGNIILAVDHRGNIAGFYEAGVGGMFGLYASASGGVGFKPFGTVDDLKGYNLLVGAGAGAGGGIEGEFSIPLNIKEGLDYSKIGRRTVEQLIEKSILRGISSKANVRLRGTENIGVGLYANLTYTDELVPTFRLGDYFPSFYQTDFVRFFDYLDYLVGERDKLPEGSVTIGEPKMKILNEKEND